VDNIEFRLVIIEDGREVLADSLPWVVIKDMVSAYPRRESSRFFFKYAAKHPSAEVRKCVADRRQIEEETCLELIQDSSIEVLSNIVQNDVFREMATIDILELLINKDTSIAALVARDVHRFTLVKTQKLAEIISAHKDFSVVLALAENSRAPKNVLRGLVNHKDSHVSQSARESLN